ncbi:Kelch repeat-containing protein [[Eubacterium] cellulosolvens]
MNKYNIKYQVSSILIIIVIVCSMVLIFSPVHTKVEAISTWTQGTDLDFENGTLGGVSIRGIGADSELVLENTYNWTNKNPPRIISPSDRNRHTMATIRGTDKVILYGGSDNAMILNDTWVYDLSDNSWTEKSPATGPGLRRDNDMAGVYGTDQVVFFGGYNGTSGFNDTWIYDLSANTWTERFPTNSPSRRYYHKMSSVYGTDKVLLFGGAYGATIFDDLWEYDLSANTWTNKNPSGSTPKGRIGHGMAGINGNDNIVMYGGYNLTSYYLSDTWAYDLSANTWTDKSPSTSPGAIDSHSMASISTDDKVMLFGGFDNTKHLIDTWVYDLSSNTWNKKSTSARPINSSNHGMASIDSSDKIILFGGNDYLRFYDVTWEYDLSANNWVKNLLPCPPAPRNAHALATLYGDDKVVLFGGNSHRIYGDTWVYDLSDNKWTQKYTAIRPNSRTRLAMASIYGDDKVVLFGGSHSSQETWVYDLSANTWTEKSPSTQPSGRIYHTMASIYNDDKVVVFGGWDGSKFLSDTWVYDLSSNTWSNKNPPGTNPVSRCYSRMTHICGDDKVILFGGLDSSYNLLSDTWVYDLSDNRWTSKSPATSPSAMSSHAMASINGTKKVMIFGGFTNSQIDETWVYDLIKNTWTQLTMTTKPFSRSSHALAYVDGADKIMLFGGYDGTDVHDDTWMFGFSSYITPGTFTSNPFYISPDAIIANLSWSATNTANTDIKFRIKTAATEAGLSIKDFVGPDGTTGTYYTVSPTTIWSGHYGDGWVQYKAYFSTTNSLETPRLDDVTISYNYLPTTELVGPDNGTMLANNKPTFSWNFIDPDSTNQIAFQVLISDNNSFQKIQYDSGKQTSTDEEWTFPAGTSYTELADGVWYWKVRTKDSDGLWGAYSQPNKMIIDVSGPVSETTMPLDSECYNDLECIAGTAADNTNGSGVYKVEVIIKRLSDDKYWSGSTWVMAKKWLTATGSAEWTYDCSKISWTSDTQYSIQSRGIDIASNIGLPSVEIIFTIDMDLPLSTIKAPEENVFLSELLNISGSASDTGGAELDLVQIQIMNTNDNSYWDGGSWRADETWLDCTGTTKWFYNSNNVKWATDIEFTINSRAIDIAGNVELPSLGITFMYDDRAPEKLEIKINDDNEYTTTTSVILYLAAEDSGSGVIQMAFSTDDTTWTDWEPFASERTFTLPPTDGEKAVYFMVMDNAGNIAEAEFDSIILDSTAPENLVIEINEGAEFTNSQTVTVELEATDSLSGVYNMSFSNDGMTWTAWTPFVTNKAFTLPSTDGEKTIFLNVQDRAGNIAEAVFDSIILDTTPPETLSVEINGGSKYTNSEAVSLNLTAADSLSGIGDMSFSTDKNTWTDWEQFTSERLYTLPPMDGEKIVYIRVRDVAGNIADSSDTIILDTEPPHSLSIIINNDDAETLSITVTLKVTALDSQSGVSQMSFSMDGVNWSAWEPRVTPKSFELPEGYGEKTIYYRVMDNAGNIAEPVTDKINFVEPPSKTPSDDKGGLISPIVLAIIIIIIIVILIIIVLAIFLTRRRKREEVEPRSPPAYEGETRPREPEPEPMAPAPFEPAPPMPPQTPAQPAPPPPVQPQTFPPAPPEHDQVYPPQFPGESSPQPYQPPYEQPYQPPPPQPYQPPQQKYQPPYEQPYQPPQDTMGDGSLPGMTWARPSDMLPPSTDYQPPSPKPSTEPPEPQETGKLQAQDKLNMLEERFLRGEISEETYNRLKAKFESETIPD